MARTKTKIDDIKSDFEAAKKFLGNDAKIMPLAEDDTKCVLVRGDSAVTYSCYALKTHLHFIQNQLG